MGDIELWEAIRHNKAYSLNHPPIFRMVQKILTYTARVFTLVLLATVILVSQTLTAYADDYVVNASVPYDAPTQPAVIQSHLDASQVDEAFITLSGTCQVLNPLAIISIWRDGVSIGSATCDSSFGISIMLAPGQNILTARTSSMSSAYGPDSLPVNITLELPPVSSPSASTPDVPSDNTTVSRTEPATAQEKIQVTNAAARSGLAIRLLEPFSILNNDNKAAITFVVDGGAAPYTMGLNWGDGRSESHTLKKSGTYQYSASYELSGIYTIRAWVRDEKGGYAEFEYAILSKLPAKKVVAGAVPVQKANFNMLGAVPLAVVGVAATGLVALTTYVGFRLGINTHISNRTSQAARLIKRSAGKSRTATSGKVGRTANRAGRKRL